MQGAWDPPDWGDLSTYGLYCLEACVRAAVIKVGKEPVKTHYGKVAQANELVREHGFPEIEDLLTNLNDARKARIW